MTTQDRSMKLLKEMGDIKESYIAEAGNSKKVRKFTMKKKSMYTGIAAACLAVAVIAGGVMNIDRSSQEDYTTQVANPFMECTTLDEAAEIAGFTLDVPESCLESTSSVIEAVENDMIQVIYQDADGKEILRIRKATGTEDVSGDYNIYENEETQDYNGMTVTARGNGDAYSVVTWTDGTYVYAIDAEDSPLSGEQIAQLLDLVH